MVLWTLLGLATVDRRKEESRMHHQIQYTDEKNADCDTQPSHILATLPLRPQVSLCRESGSLRSPSFHWPLGCRGEALCLIRRPQASDKEPTVFLRGQFNCLPAGHAGWAWLWPGEQAGGAAQCQQHIFPCTALGC